MDIRSCGYMYECMHACIYVCIRACMPQDLLKGPFHRDREVPNLSASYKGYYGCSFKGSFKGSIRA